MIDGNDRRWSFWLDEDATLAQECPRATPGSALHPNGRTGAAVDLDAAEE